MERFHHYSATRINSVLITILLFCISGVLYNCNTVSNNKLSSITTNNSRQVIPTETAKVTSSIRQTIHEPWVNIGFIDKHIFFISVDPVNSDVIYAGVENNLYKSEDGGNKWEQIIIGSNDPIVYDLAIDHSSPKNIFIGAYGGVYRSRDGGKNWIHSFWANSGPGVSTVIIDPKSTNIIYAGSFAGEGYNQKGKYLFVSKDGGNNWSLIDSGIEGLDIHDIAIDPNNHHVLYLSTANGMYQSINSGNNWNEINNGLSKKEWIRKITIDPKTPSIIYIGSFENGIYKSINSGSKWESVNNGLPKGITVSSIIMDPISPNIIFCAISILGKNDGGVYRSIDGGMTWDNVGLVGLNVYSVTINPSYPNIIYAGTTNGIYYFDQSTRK